MNSTNKTFIEIADCDCEQSGGIMEIINESAIEQCDTNDLKKIKGALNSAIDIINDKISDRKDEIEALKQLTPSL